MGTSFRLAEQQEQSRVDLLECHRQPGRLRISRHACALRYLLAQKTKEAIPNDEFGMARKAGLDICKDCPEGQSHAETVSET